MMSRWFFILLALILLANAAEKRQPQDEGGDDEDEDDDDDDDQEIVLNKPSQHRINTRPIIGVLSQQSLPALEPKINKSTSYIAASYIKWVEAAGGQTVPILNTYTEEHVLKIMSRINGVLIPGGKRDLYDTNYGRVSRIIFKEVVRYNNEGTFFPLFGTCLGFQALNVIAAETQEDQRILTKVKAKKFMKAIDLTTEAFSSRLLSGAPWPLIQAMTKEKLSIHNHKYGLAPKKFKDLPKLGEFFKPLATARGRNGVRFVSIVEGKKYPVYGVQFHPEKNQYEWTRSVDFNHEPNAIELSQYFARFFVNEARKNFHEFEDFDEEEKHLMFNYQMVYSGGTTAFQQVYAFGNHSETYMQ